MSAPCYYCCATEGEPELYPNKGDITHYKPQPTILHQHAILHCHTNSGTKTTNVQDSKDQNIYEKEGTVNKNDTNLEMRED